MPRRSSKKFTLHIIISIYLIFQLALNLRLLMYGADLYSCQIRYMNQHQFVIYITYFHSHNCNVTLLPVYKLANDTETITTTTTTTTTTDKTTTEEKLNETALVESVEQFEDDYTELDESEEMDETDEFEEADENEQFVETEEITDSFLSTKIRTVINSFVLESKGKTHSGSISASSHRNIFKTLNPSTKKVSANHNTRHLPVTTENHFIEDENQFYDEKIELSDLNASLRITSEQHMINVYHLMTTVKWPLEANAYYRTHAFIQIYLLFVSLCLILTLLFLILVLFYGVKFDDPLCFYVIFILMILLGVLLIIDLIAVIIYAIDNDKTYNFIGWLKFIGVRKITNEVASFNSKVLRSFFISPARLLTLIACRFVLMWFANALIFFYFMYKVIAVLTRKDYASSSVIEDTTSTNGGRNLRLREGNSLTSAEENHLGFEAPVSKSQDPQQALDQESKSAEKTNLENNLTSDQVQQELPLSRFRQSTSGLKAKMEILLLEGPKFEVLSWGIAGVHITEECEKESVYIKNATNAKPFSDD